jgi:hypothetical protein
MGHPLDGGAIVTGWAEANNRPVRVVRSREAATVAQTPIGVEVRESPTGGFSAGRRRAGWCSRESAAVALRVHRYRLRRKSASFDVAFFRKRGKRLGFRLTRLFGVTGFSSERWSVELKA